MDNFSEFLVDSNWLVTLSSILVTIYVFVLSVPVLLQQTFMTERLREVANHHDYFKAETSALKNIGILLVAFIVLYGNPAWKYLFFSTLEGPQLVKCLALIHLIGLTYFLYIVFTMYSFLNKYVLFKPTRSWLGILGKKDPVAAQTATRYNTTNYLKILDVVKKSIISRYESSKTPVELRKIESIDDLVTLANVTEDNLNREVFLNAIQDIVLCIINNPGYKGDKLKPILQDILQEQVNTGFTQLSATNINAIISIAKIVIKRYNEEPHEDSDLNFFDMNEVRKLFISLTNHLANNISVNGNHQLFIDAFNTLRAISPSYYDCFLVQKSLRDTNKYTYINMEVKYLKALIKSSKEPNPVLNNYLIAYIAWFTGSPVRALRNVGLTECNSLYVDTNINMERCASALKFFESRAEYDTVDQINESLKYMYA